jgi:hypothetical protein
VRKSLSRNGVRRPDADPIRKARFREAAREIVAKDRLDRKYGFPVDTAGAVARTMERAYRQGFADAQDKSSMPAARDTLTAALGVIEGARWPGDAEYAWGTQSVSPGSLPRDSRDLRDATGAQNADFRPCRRISRSRDSSKPPF